MDTGREPDHRDVQIVDLPGEGDAARAGKRVLLPSRFRPPPVRRRRLIMLVVLAAMTLLIILASIASIRGFVARIIPTPTPTPPLYASLFYVQGEPPWGQLVIDGLTIAHLPAFATGTPLRLSYGRHMLQWRAAPFITQSCTLTVPADFGSDTCIDNTSVLTRGGKDVMAVTFMPTLNNLPPDQQASLISATQVALDGQRSTTTVRPGEYYALPASCRETLPIGIQIAQCYYVARQPLKATLSFQLDVSASEDAPCDSPPTTGACTFSAQNCHLFCSMDFAPSAWDAGIAVQASWTFTRTDGQVVARNVPDNPSEEDFVPMRITWDRVGWHVTPLLSDSSSSSGYPVCQPLESNLNLLGEPMTAGPWQWKFAAGSVLADGCVAEAILESASGATPVTPAHGAYFLYRFGIILAANSEARNSSDWPYLPVADAYEQALAQRTLS